MGNSASRVGSWTRNFGRERFCFHDGLRSEIRVEMKTGIDFGGPALPKVLVFLKPTFLSWGNPGNCLHARVFS